MDVNCIISNEGYRREDLTEEAKNVMSWLDVVYEQMESADWAYKDNEADALHEKVINSVKREAHDEFMAAPGYAMADVQISLAEA